jgi:hypothetical protein
MKTASVTVITAGVHGRCQRYDKRHDHAPQRRAALEPKRPLSQTKPACHTLSILFREAEKVCFSAVFCSHSVIRIGEANVSLREHIFRITLNPGQLRIENTFRQQEA